MKFIFAVVGMIQVATSLKIGSHKLSGALMGIQNATKSLANLNTTSNFNQKLIINEVEQLQHIVGNGLLSGNRFTDEEVKAILGLNDGLYGMWYPYAYPIQPPVVKTSSVVYEPAVYNPWWSSPEYVVSIDALR